MDEHSSDGHLATLRSEMVSQQIAARGVTAPRVLQAMRKIPRELFVPPQLRHFAYNDSAMSIGSGQTISQPFIVGYMLEAVELNPDDRVLEVGTGSGYGAALLGELTDEVHTIERLPTLAAAAAERLRRLGANNVHVHNGDGTLGHPAAAPYRAIVVTAGGPVVPASLQQQLAFGGRLVMPIGSPGDQLLIRIRRTGPVSYKREQLIGCRFVPLVGDEGWPAEQ